VTPRKPPLRAEPRPLRRRLELVVFLILLAQTLQSERVRRSIRRCVFVLERVEEGMRVRVCVCVRGIESSRAPARVAKVQSSWRGRRSAGADGGGGRTPAVDVDRGAALEGETRVEDAVFERVVARYGGLA